MMDMSTSLSKLKNDRSGITLTPTKSSDHFLKYGRFVAQTLWNDGKIIIPDVSIEMPCGSFQAHKLVLACHSEYFRRWLEESLDTKICDLKVVDYNFVTSKNFFQVLKFLYTGSITLKKDNLPEIIKISEKLGMDKLHTVCEWANELLQRSIRTKSHSFTTKPANSVKNYQYSNTDIRMDDSPLPQILLGDKLVTEELLKGMTVANLNLILEQDNFDCSQLDKFKLVMKWQEVGEGRNQCLPFLLRYVDFSQVEDDDKMYCCQKLQTYPNCGNILRKILRDGKASVTKNTLSAFDKTPDPNLRSEGTFAQFDQHDVGLNSLATSLKKDKMGIDNSNNTDIQPGSCTAATPPTIRKQKFYKGKYDESNNEYPTALDKLSANKEVDGSKFHEAISKEWESASNNSLDKDQSKSSEEEETQIFQETNAIGSTSPQINKSQRTKLSGSSHKSSRTKGRIPKRGIKPKKKYPKSPTPMVKKHSKKKHLPPHASYSYSNNSSDSDLSSNDEHDSNYLINKGSHIHPINSSSSTHSPDNNHDTTIILTEHFVGSKYDSKVLNTSQQHTEERVIDSQKDRSIKGSDLRDNDETVQETPSPLHIPNQHIRKDGYIKPDSKPRSAGIPFRESCSETYVPDTPSDDSVGQENVGIPVYMRNYPFVRDYEMIMLIEEEPVKREGSSSIHTETKDFGQRSINHNYQLSLELQATQPYNYPRVLNNGKKSDLLISPTMDIADREIDCDGYVLSYVRTPQVNLSFRPEGSGQGIPLAADSFASNNSQKFYSPTPSNFYHNAAKNGPLPNNVKYNGPITPNYNNGQHNSSQDSYYPYYVQQGRTYDRVTTSSYTR